MKCAEVADYLRSIGSWVDWSNTCDTFKAGDPSREVTRVAVAWKATWDALREADSRGAELFVSHESICVNAVNGSTEPEATFALPSERPKFDWIERTGIVVYRCHDVWDRFPGEGVRDSWLKGLALGGDVVAAEGSFYVTEIAPMAVADLAQHILDRIRPLGQNGVLVAGDAGRQVKRIATGTGVTIDVPRMAALGADAGICTDDFFLHVRMGVHARELGVPLIFVNHGVSEEWGIENLARHLGRAFPSLEVFHIPQRCPYEVVC